MSQHDEPIEAQVVPPQTGLTTVSEVELAIKEMETLAKKLDSIRGLLIQRTVPGDWIKMGDTVYLEGDGATRLAPLLGLQISRVRMTEETKESGARAITYTADFSSKLFGTMYSDVSRTRAEDDDFLMKKDGSYADIADVRAAAYKGMVARGVQLVAGLSGLKPEDMKQRFGFDVSNGAVVEYKNSQAAAKRNDQAAAADGQKEVARILFKIFGGDTKVAADWLESATENKQKGWPGKRDPNKLTEAGASFVLKKLRPMEAEYDREHGAGDEAPE